MIYLQKIRKICKSLLCSILSLLKSSTTEGSIMENQIDSILSLTKQELIALYIVIGFHSMIDRLLYQHKTAGTDV
jgi:hypothetical protein